MIQLAPGPSLIARSDEVNRIRFVVPARIMNPQTELLSPLIDEMPDLRVQVVGAVAGILLCHGAALALSGVVEKLMHWGAELGGESAGKRESVTFSLPRELKG